MSIITDHASQFAGALNSIAADSRIKRLTPVQGVGKGSVSKIKRFVQPAPGAG